MPDPDDPRQPQKPKPAARIVSTPASDPLIGRVIEDRFEILSQLARGGMGNIYKAKQVPLGRICAVKVLSASFEGDDDPQFRKRFFLEASTAAKLTHPNTVRIFDYGRTEDDIYFIAMEYIEGRTLFRLMRDEGPFSETRAAHIAAQICRSLREAHEHGVVHRDLKPGNVIVVDRADEADSVKVLDFGLVKELEPEQSQVTQAGLRMGSPKYMAPEQAMGDVVSPRTDIYSLGVLLYEMLSGRPPFDKRKAAATAMAHVSDPVPPMQTYRADLVVSPEMESIVYRCLLKDPERRFASMQETLDALKSAVAEGAGERLPLGLRASLMPNEPAPPSQRRPSIPAASAARAVPEAQRSQTGESSTMERFDRKDPPPSRVRSIAIALTAVIGVAAAFLAFRRESPSEIASTETSGAEAEARAIVAPIEPSEPAPAAPAPEPTASTIASAAAAPEPFVSITSEPPGASVWRDGVKICDATPCRAAKSATPLAFQRKGFSPAVVAVAAEQDEVSVRLAKEPEDAAIAAPPPAAAPQPTATAADPYKPSPY